MQPILRRLGAVLLLAFGLMLPSGAILAQAPELAAAPTTPQTAPASPALYEVTAPGQPGKIHLFGTVHLLPPGLDWRTPALRKTLAEATLMVQELPPEAMADPQAALGAMLRFGMLPPDQTLPGVIGADLYQQVKAQIPSTLPEAFLQRLRPWLVTMLLSQTAMTRTGLDARNGVDIGLVADAKARALPMIGLETVEQQAQMLATMEEEGPTVVITQALEELDKARDIIAGLVETWSRGDMAAVAAVTYKDADRYPKAHAALITNRNQLWVKALTPYLAKKESLLVAVGAGHISGRDGLVAMFEKQGFRVRPIPSGR
jgi:uncharacterized protein